MTERKLTYTLLAEGIAENYFIPKYLEKMGASKSVKLVRSKKILPTSTKPSKYKVYSNLLDFAKASVLNGENLFIAGVDLDLPDHTDEQEHHKSEFNKLLKELEGVDHTVILFVPVQVFDTWLLYCTGAKPNSLESKNGKEVKTQLYNASRPNRNAIEQRCEEVFKSTDFNLLAKQSRSFNHFHQQVKKAFGIKK